MTTDIQPTAAHDPAPSTHIGASLTIVIPALDEEEAIGATIERCLAARPRIQAAGVERITVVVVSDGSTDRTPEIAAGYDEIELIIFPQNRGYGAAIKEGWRRHPSDLLAFLDADGTCDPEFFASLCRVALDEAADVVLGSRLGPDSKMPRIRRFGNNLFATLLGVLSGRHITDTASGMRVIRRQSLKHIYPLPNGLHFTPSMSARALLNDLRVIEVPMRYEERVGESKLNALKDGVRFLKTILAGLVSYRPERLLLFPLIVCFVGIVALAAYPTEFYWRNSRLEEWMIYRFVVCQLLGSVGVTLLFAIALLHRFAVFGPRRESAGSFWPGLIAYGLGGWRLGLFAFGVGAVSLGFLWPGLMEYATTATVTLHWSRLLAGAFGTLLVAECAVFGVLFTVVTQWTEQMSERLRDAKSDAAATVREQATTPPHPREAN